MLRRSLLLSHPKISTKSYRLLSFSSRHHFFKKDEPPNDPKLDKEETKEKVVAESTSLKYTSDQQKELDFQTRRENFIQHYENEMNKMEDKFNADNRFFKNKVTIFGNEKFPKGVTRFDQRRRENLKHLVNNAKNPEVYEPLKDPMGLDQKHNIFGHDYQYEIDYHKANTRLIGTYTDKGKFVWDWEIRIKQMNMMLFYTGIGLFMLSLAIMSVPLYKIFCASLGAGHSLDLRKKATEELQTMDINYDQKMRIHFTANKTLTMDWNFKSDQEFVEVFPGETALVFYKAKNPTNQPVIGVSTYHITPFEAAPYFNKIQCFCFEQQMLGPNEEVELPVFFFIDPEIMNDPACQGVSNIQLSYTFFKVTKDFDIPLPGFSKFGEDDAVAMA